MTDDRNKLLAVFEGRVYELLELCEKQKRRISELGLSLELKEKELQQAIQLKEDWKAKYYSLLTARVVSASEGEMRSAKRRLSDLVRKVDKCIGLLKSE